MPRDADILAGLSDEAILAEMRAGNRAVTEAWNRRHEERMRAAGYPEVISSVDAICAIPTERWERLGRLLRGEE